MTDVTGSAGQFHNCTNDVRAAEPIPSSVCTFTIRNTASPYGSADFRIAGSNNGAYMNAVKDTHLSVPDGSAVALSRVPNTSPELMQGLVSLYELKDLKSTLDAIPIHLLWAVARRNREESLEHFKSWVASIRRLSRTRTSLMQALIGADLQWKFGIKPFLNDVQKMMSVLGNVNKRIEDLCKKDFVCRGTFEDTREATDIRSPGFAAGTMSSYKTSGYTTMQTKKKWTYGVVRRLNRSSFPSYNAIRLQLLRDQLGLSVTAAQLWEAVPYSFVVDWFLPIQTFLEQFARQPTPSWMTATGYWYTVKTETRGSVAEEIQPYVTAGHVVEGLTGQYPFNANWRRTNYQRTALTTPPSQLLQPIYIPSIKLPNLGQFGTGIELALQKIITRLT